MFLQLFLAFLLVLALAKPYFPSAAPLDRYVLALDASMSMTARDVSPSRFERAKDDMKELVLSSKAGTVFSVAVIGGDPYIAVNDTSDKHAVTDKIDAVTPEYRAADVDAANALLKTMSGRGAVYVFSDKRYGFDGATDIPFGVSSENMAVSRVAASLDGDRLVALVVVANFGSRPGENAVEIYCDGEFSGVKDVYIESGGEQSVFFMDLPPDARDVEARLADDDMLSADDCGYAVVPAPRKQKVALVTERNVFLENALSLIQDVELYKISPENAENLSGFYLYVFDGTFPSGDMPADGHILAFNPPEGNPLVEVTGETPPLEVGAPTGANVSPFFDYITDMRFSVAKAKNVTPPEWAEEIGSSLILAGRVGGRKAVVVAFDLHDTDLPLRKEFPVFIYNLTRFFIPQSAAANATDIYCGEPIELNAQPNARKVSVASPDGTMTEIALASPVYTPRAPGFYVVEQETDGGGVYDGFAVNAAPGESDITPDAVVNETDINPGAYSVPTDKSADIYPLIAALLLILAEWRVFTRGN
jgi:hypothetical protein